MLRLLTLLYFKGDKQVYGPPTGLPSPMDVCNTKCIANASPTLSSTLLRSSGYLNHHNNDTLLQDKSFSCDNLMIK